MAVMPMGRLPLSRSMALQRLMQVYLVAAGVSIYDCGTAHFGAPLGGALAMLCCAALGCYGRRALRRGPDALEIDGQGGAALLYSDGADAARAVQAQLIHAVHWPGLLQSLEFRCENRVRRSVLVMADAMPPESFRVLAAWAGRTLHRKTQTAWSAPQNSV
jgi:hypothetical protein